MLNINNNKTSGISLSAGKHTRRGFTLLELLIVIAILAVLSTVVILVLNPGEYLAQARDSQRISDLSTLNSAIALDLTSSASIGTCVGYAVCTGGTTADKANGDTDLCGAISSSTLVGGTGWVPINFSALPGGSPIAREPIDPSNNSSYHYAYRCNAAANTYELDAILESAKYKAGSTANDLGAKDGGNSPNYEIGTDLTLIN